MSVTPPTFVDQIDFDCAQAFCGAKSSAWAMAADQLLGNLNGFAQAIGRPERVTASRPGVTIPGISLDDLAVAQTLAGYIRDVLKASIPANGPFAILLAAARPADIAPVAAQLAIDFNLATAYVKKLPTAGTATGSASRNRWSRGLLIVGSTAVAIGGTIAVGTALAGHQPRKRRRRTR